MFGNLDYSSFSDLPQLVQAVRAVVSLYCQLIHCHEAVVTTCQQCTFEPHDSLNS